MVPAIPATSSGGPASAGFITEQQAMDVSLPSSSSSSSTSSLRSGASKEEAVALISFSGANEEISSSLCISDACSSVISVECQVYQIHGDLLLALALAAVSVADPHASFCPKVCVLDRPPSSQHHCLSFFNDLEYLTR
ncbi:uncharacterized protein A4U43_C01F22700 [Asparagus officinalis]|uniref:Uncharacterized protein n=1 Tax=Asparagus officinalis TaxID=4686 RepID=A0A5P1FT75_ASPOF|nr:uncharacterized protein A4U43_C01F22700 [Asparagus officinalis]